MLTLLREADLAVAGRMPWSSNATFLVELRGGAHQERAVYKPIRGERPLWDFPPGLGKREVAAYELARALGWDLVPPTVLRDGPLGVVLGARSEKRCRFGFLHAPAPRCPASLRRAPAPSRLLAPAPRFLPAPPH